MTTVPPKTLSWLWSILGRDYIDPNRTYSDVAHTLGQYPTIAPRTDVYTYENGTSALLLHLTGTIPVQFRGATYRFPLELWIPHRYPQESPIVYVVPSDGMVIRPGQHVSGEGKVYHPYLARWAQAWDRSNILEALRILGDIFSREPPVIAKQQISRSPVHNPAGPPPLPPLPQEFQRPHSTETGQAHPQSPPPPPPKGPASFTRNDLPEEQRFRRYDVPPPIPSQATGSPSRRSTFGEPYSNGQPPQSAAQFQPQRASSLRHSLMPGGQTLGYPPAQGEQPGPIGHAQGSERYQGFPSPSQRPVPTQFPGPIHPSGFRPPSGAFGQPTGTIDPRLQQYGQPPSQPLWSQSQPKPQPVDLLDSPFDVSLPTSDTTAIPAPPIPRNPEKEALLQTLSQTLTQQLHSAISQNTSALPSLESQQAALANSQSTLESEIANITNLNHSVQSNISILQNAIRQADGAISDAQSRAVKGDIPKVDDVLVPPTVVGKQLYDVVTEGRGIEVAIWALQTALVRGRINTDVWARRTRELSREQFAKKALEKKIGKGLGLEQ